MATTEPDEGSHGPPKDTTADRVTRLAADMFAERGYAAVSMRQIAEAAGIRAASLYNHYTDKESLYFGALTYAFRVRVEKVDAALQSTGSPRQRLRATVLALAHSSLEDVTATRLLQRELLDADARRLKRLTSTLFQEPFDRMVQLLTEIHPQRDPARLALLLSALIIGYVSLNPITASLDNANLLLDADGLTDEALALLLDAGGDTP